MIKVVQSLRQKTHDCYRHTKWLTRAKRRRQ